MIKTVGEFMDAVNALLSSGVLTREMPVKCAWEGCSWPVQNFEDMEDIYLADQSRNEILAGGVLLSQDEVDKLLG